MNRRDFLRYSLAATGAFGLNLYSIPSFALDNRREKLIYIFLRGGADVLSLFPPKLAQTCSLGAVYDGRHPLYNLRGTLTTNMANSFLFGSAGCQFGDYRDNEAVRPLEIAGYPVHFHPGFKDLEPALNAKKLALFLHTGSLHSSRSHFDQQDFIESGSRWYRYGTGYLARAGSFLPGREPIAIGGAAPAPCDGAAGMRFPCTPRQRHAVPIRRGPQRHRHGALALCRPGARRIVQVLARQRGLSRAAGVSAGRCGYR